MDEQRIEEIRREIVEYSDWLDEIREEHLLEAENIRKIYQEIHGHFANYIRVVSGIGYAGIFTIWAFTRESLNESASMIVALLISASLLIFVLWEVFSMIVNQILFISISKRKLAEIEALDEKTHDIAVEKTKSLRRKLAKWQSRINFLWIFVLIFTILTALSAAGFLTFNFAANAIGWDQFPRYLGYCGSCI